MKHILVILLLSSLLLHSFSAFGLDLQSSTIIEKKTNVLGVEINYALMDLDFGEEIYRFRSVTCPNFDCGPPVTQDCSCDYTDMDDCGHPVDPSCTNQCPTQIDISPTGTPYYLYYCDLTQPWTTIEANARYDFTITEALSLRYKADTQICEGLRLFVEQSQGFVTVNVSPLPYFSYFGRISPTTDQDYELMLQMCPTDNQSWAFSPSWTRDTYFITIVPQTANATFTVELLSKDIDPTPVPNNCTQVLSDHQCVNNGEAVQGYGLDEEIIYYTYAVSYPQIVAFSFPSLNQDIDFFISDSPNMTNPTSLSSPRWLQTNELDDYLTLSLSPISASEPLVLYIGVSTFYESYYIFTISTLGYNEIQPITSESPQAGTFSIAGTSRLILPSGDISVCTSWSRCTEYSIQYPFLQNLPIWPLPSQFVTDQRFSGLVFQPDSIMNVTTSSGYRAAFLLSYKQGDKTTINQDFDSILNSKIEFQNNLVTKDLAPLTGRYTFAQKTLSCNYDSFESVATLIDGHEDALFSTSDSIELNNLIFKIDALTLSDEWTACTSAAMDLLNIETTVTPALTTYCPYLTTDPLYATDPCCNSSLSFFSCCVPRLMNVAQATYNGPNSDLVSGRCASPECTMSVLSEYQDSILSTDDCAVEAFVQDNANVEVLAVIRACKAVLSYQYCESDADCSGYTCDVYSRNCLVPSVQQDKNYLTCIFDNLEANYKQYLVYKHQLNASSTAEIVENAFSVFSMQDCTYFTGQAYRTKYYYYNLELETNRCYPFDPCLDTACETVHDVCYDGQYSNWEIESYSTVDDCTNYFGFCNGIDCDPNDTADQCQSLCEAQAASTSSFCGYCSSNVTSCFNVAEVTSESDCSAHQTCVLPLGLYDDTLDQETCESDQTGVCDQPCGYECVGPAPTCANPDANETTCGNAGESWSSALGVCVYSAANQAQCTTAGYLWVDCSAQSFDQCYSYGLATNLCSISEIQCTTKEQCESLGGQCSDSYFFSPDYVNFYPEMHAKCTRNHYVYKLFWKLPTCDADLEKDSPLGCYPYDFDYFEASSQEECEAQGEDFKWWSPATTQSQCESRMGCKILDISKYNLPYNFRFNQMNESQCVSCGPDVFASYEKMFSWTPGKWKKGVYVNTSWIPYTYSHLGNVETLLDYQYLHTELLEAVSSHITVLYRSESLCRMERTEENLKSITCSCSGPGGDDCFTTSSLILGETSPCQGAASSYEFSNGIVYFNEASVTFACTSVLVSQIPQQLYTSTVPLTLSSSFVSYRKPDNYAVLNSKEAIIGTIIGDGVKISSPGIQSLSPCLLISDQTNKNYPIYDFAQLSGSSTNPEPMELDIQVYYESSKTFICANLTVSDSSQLSIFPIRRIDLWKEPSKTVFNSTSRGLIYTLAVIFLLVGIWGLFQLSISAYKRYVGLESIKLVHLLILFVTMFIIIRAIYFFILPSGALTNNSVADYILVVLPTFMYFTSFTIIIVLWYIIMKSKNIQRDVLTRINLVILIVNIILYILFIIIIIVFHFTESSPPNNCGGRIVVDVSNTTPQRVVSIFYAAFQALISLIIGAAFVYLGGSLYLAMKFKKVSETNSSAAQQQKVFVITFACSIGFILHCVFVLILVGAEPSNIVFSFLGLIITEIAPSLSILYSYNQGNLVGIKQTTNTANLQYIGDSTGENFYSSSSKRSFSSKAHSSTMTTNSDS